MAPVSSQILPQVATLTPEQENAANTILNWHRNRFTRQQLDMTVGGLAGTGKSTLANVLPGILEIDPSRIAYCAPTGKAASRLIHQGTTIHRLIYGYRDIHCTACPRYSNKNVACHDSKCHNCQGVFERRAKLEGTDLIIVDEASMVNGRLYKDLKEFGVPIIWIGDHGQLPPVKGTFNLMQNPVVRLETIHRQQADSPILKLAMQARKYGRVGFGVHGEGVVKHRYEGNLPDLQDRLVLCGRNDLRVRLNGLARKALGFEEGSLPVAGDRVVCLRNDYESLAFNGTVGTVVSCLPGDEDECYELTVKMDDGHQCTVQAWTQQFGATETLREAPRSVGLWDYGYAMTVHKCQGSEADDVVLFEQPIGDRNRWLYTGITRAKKRLEIISR